MSDKPHVVLSGKFAIELTPLADQQVASAITADGFTANALGFGIALGSLIGWFLASTEDALAKQGLAVDTPEKAAAFNLAMMVEINLGISQTLRTSQIIPAKGKQQ